MAEKFHGDIFVAIGNIFRIIDIFLFQPFFASSLRFGAGERMSDFFSPCYNVGIIIKSHYIAYVSVWRLRIQYTTIDRFLYIMYIMYITHIHVVWERYSVWKVMFFITNDEKEWAEEERRRRRSKWWKKNRRRRKDKKRTAKKARSKEILHYHLRSVTFFPNDFLGMGVADFSSYFSFLLFFLKDGFWVASATLP